VDAEEIRKMFLLPGIETRPSSPSLYLLSYAVRSCRFMFIKFTFIALEYIKFRFQIMPLHHGIKSLGEGSLSTDIHKCR
jgi:hypothetical protein